MVYTTMMESLEAKKNHVYFEGERKVVLIDSDIRVR